MKRWILGITLATLAGAAIADTPFCDGYAAGYARGYCAGQYGCIAPLTPMCPMPNMGQDSYQDGYDRGYQAGQQDKR